MQIRKFALFPWSNSVKTILKYSWRILEKLVKKIRGYSLFSHMSDFVSIYQCLKAGLQECIIAMYISDSL